MRAKQLKLLITFFTTTAAIEMEKICMQNDIPGRLIPVPRDITSSCGMSWCAPVDSRALIERAVNEAKIQTDGWYEVLI